LNHFLQVRDGQAVRGLPAHRIRQQQTEPVSGKVVLPAFIMMGGWMTFPAIKWYKTLGRARVGQIAS